MEKKLIRWSVVSLLAIIVLFIWWVTPVTFMRNIDTDDISSIEVIGGELGDRFIIFDHDDISYIIHNIQNTTLKKDKLSTGYSGALWELNFKKSNGKTAISLTINAKNVLRKDPFFYETVSGELCIDYLGSLQQALSS